jgi:hypothetical protein
MSLRDARHATMFVLAAAAAVAAAGCNGDAGGSTPTDGGTIDAPAFADAGPVPDAGDPGGSDANIAPACVVGACQGAIARTCGQTPVVIRCSDFGASCGEFEDLDTGAPFGWCDCGDLGSGDGFCFGGRNLGIVCFDGLGGLADCGRGMLCVESPGSPLGISCDCDNLPDGVCPAVSCGGDPDCADCTPDCSGRGCGDNGCGGDCGTCPLGQSCAPDGTCDTVCVPSCDGRECGDDGCGGDCGHCGLGATCSDAGQCEGDCSADCDGRVCGDDGCDGSCGDCEGALACYSDGSCDCDFFATVDYTLDGEGIDYDEVLGVIVDIVHVGRAGDEAPASVCLAPDTPGCDTSSTVSFWGCEPNLRVRREYFLFDGDSCVSEEELVTGQTTFVIPPPTIDALGCEAGPL